MGFIETIAGEAFHLAPYFGGQCIGVTDLLTISKKFFFDQLKLVIGPVLSAHGPAQNVGFSQIESRKIVGNFNDVFLEYHHTKCFSQVFFKKRMQVFDLIPVMITINIFPHHARLRYSRPDD